MWWLALVPPAYLVGTFPSAVLVARANGLDITRIGSGNPGASNVTRALGWRKGVWVFVLDAAKGAVAAGAGLLVEGRPAGYVLGAAAVVGHVAPITRRFRGGKGVATGGGVVAVLHPIVFAAIALGWMAVSRLSRRASVASIAMVAVLPVAIWLRGRAVWEIAATLALCALVMARHTGNIVRLVTRREPSLRSPATQAAAGRSLAGAPSLVPERADEATADRGAFGRPVTQRRESGPMRLLEPLQIGTRTARNRVMFGPHVTNLASEERSPTTRQVAYYEHRARGGCGTIVVEGASVDPSDWPYERALLAERCADGWRAIVDACRPHGALVLASLDHAGSQGSSAYNQLPLWAPSRVPDVVSREVPKWMEPDDIATVVAGFGRAAERAVGAGCDGVEINAGQHSLVRQFLSGLTNQRDDEWGADRLLFARQVIEATRAGAGDAIVGLRLSCDELAPWAGITPEMAPEIAATLVAAGVDYVVVVRGSIFSAEKTRPDFHEPAGFNAEVCAAVHARVDVPVFLQGSVTDAGQAEWALGGSDDPARCDGVEMTRAQIADPQLVAKLAAGTPEQIRPCTRCNQACQVRDARNPLVTCVGEPSTGHEIDDPDWYAAAARPRDVTVIGGGPAGLETARVAAIRGHRVTIVERAERLGGMTAVAGPNAPITDWLESECTRLGVTIDRSVCWKRRNPTDQADRTGVVVQCTGGVPGRRTYSVDDGAVVVDVGELRRGEATLPDTGDVVLFDPIGGPIAIALAEELGERAVLVTQDHIAGNELSRTGDLAPANVRLAQRGVRIEKRTLLRAARAGAVEVEDRFSGERRTIPCLALVDCAFRLPDDPIDDADIRAGDCVAPRTLLEAILEGRRAAVAIDQH